MIPYPQAHPSFSFSEEFQLPLQAWSQAGPVGSRRCAPLPRPSHPSLALNLHSHSPAARRLLHLLLPGFPPPSGPAAVP